MAWKMESNSSNIPEEEPDLCCSFKDKDTGGRQTQAVFITISGLQGQK